MPTVVVPIGFESGVLWVHGEARHEITLPTASASLPHDRWLVWWSAFADLDAAAEHTLTRERLADVSGKLGVDSPRDHLKSLYDDGLLADLDIDRPEEFLRRYKLYPTGDGMGEVEKESGKFQIAREGKTLLEANVHVYALWCTSVYDPSLWDGITGYAADLGVRPEDLSGVLAQALPAIISNRCGYLQPA